MWTRTEVAGSGGTLRGYEVGGPLCPIGTPTTATEEKEVVFGPVIGRPLGGV